MELCPSYSILLRRHYHSKTEKKDLHPTPSSAGNRSNCSPATFLTPHLERGAIAASVYRTAGLRRCKTRDVKPGTGFLSRRQIRKAIDCGEPVLVGRAFSRKRDALHRELATRYAHDPKATLPDPSSKAGRQGRRQWPTRRDGPGHMSVITGYNEKRQEILFT